MAKKIKTTHEEIAKYWGDKVYEGDMGCDESEWLERCWRCGGEVRTKKSLNRCHIIPAQSGGEDTPSNLVLLCKSCHAEAPSFNDDPTIMWDWIKRSCKPMYDTYWLERYREEFFKLFKREPDFNNMSLEKLKDIMYKNAGIHFGDKPISCATHAYAMKRAGA